MVASVPQRLLSGLEQENGRALPAAQGRAQGSRRWGGRGRLCAHQEGLVHFPSCNGEPLKIFK